MSLSAPSIDYGQIGAEASQLAQQQEGYDIGNAESQAALNNVNQITPFGSLTYTPTGTGPGGVQTYTATTAYTPEQQNLLNIGQGTQTEAAAGANQLLGGADYGGSNPISDIGSMTSGLTGQQMNSYLTSMEPFFGYQQEGLNSQLANQGLTPGSPAYAQAQNLLEQNQAGQVAGAAAQFEPAAFGQAESLYNLPLSTAESLYSVGTPASIENNLINTPQTSIQVPSTASAYSAAAGPAEQEAQLQEQQYGSTMAGLGQLGSTGLLAGLLLSDKRLKKDIHEIGKTKSGIPVVQFKWKHNDMDDTGVLADDVEKVHPDCVVELGGLKHVNYDELERREAV